MAKRRIKEDWGYLGIAELEKSFITRHLSITVMGRRLVVVHSTSEIYIHSTKLMFAVLSCRYPNEVAWKKLFYLVVKVAVYDTLVPFSEEYYQWSEYSRMY